MENPLGGAGGSSQGGAYLTLHDCFLQNYIVISTLFRTLRKVPLILGHMLLQVVCDIT